MSVDLKQFHQVFIEESFEGLDAMENALMELNPEAPDSETINTIFRSAHSIKGGAGTFGFKRLADFTHILETLLDQIRSNSRGLDTNLVNLFLQSVDCMREMLDLIQQDSEEYPESARELKQKFEEVLNGDSKVASKPAQNNEQQNEDKPVCNILSRYKTWSIQFHPHSDIIRSGNDPLRILRELSRLGKLNCTQVYFDAPGLAEFDPDTCYLAWDLELRTSADLSEIEEVFEWVIDDSSVEIKEIKSDSVAHTRVNFKPHQDIYLSGNDPYRIIEELLINFEVIAIDVITDQLPELKSFNSEHCYLSWSIDLAGSFSQDDVLKAFEWVVDEAEIGFEKIEADEAKEPNQSDAENETDSKPANSNKTQAASDKAPSSGRKSTSSDASSIRVGIDKIDNLINMVGELVITQSMLGQLSTDFEMSKIPKLMEGLSQLELNTRELQESVMRIRMLPISFAFSRFPRMVRDLGQRLGKKIHLEMRGENTELDKTVMEKIGDPLVHLVRNAVDHGIELPEQRRAAGKDEEGHIILNAYHQGGNVNIEIIDDGKGLDRNVLIAKAIDKGLLSEQDAFALSDEQAFDLIFHAGFSTAKEVSDVSGRGVGMDVVKKNIHALNGNIELHSKMGEGSKIKISLPLTLAILDGQLVSVCDQTYIFPIVSIIESMQYKREAVNDIAGGCSVFMLRDEYVPVIKLHDIFNISKEKNSESQELMVVVESEGEKVGLVVDELQAQQQVVIKSLEENYHRVEGVSGATILGDGTVALILDIPGIVRLAGIDKVNEQVRELTFAHKNQEKKSA